MMDKVTLINLMLKSGTVKLIELLDEAVVRAKESIKDK